MLERTIIKLQDFSKTILVVEQEEQIKEITLQETQSQAKLLEMQNKHLKRRSKFSEFNKNLKFR